MKKIEKKSSHIYEKKLYIYIYIFSIYFQQLKITNKKAKQTTKQHNKDFCFFHFLLLFSFHFSFFNLILNKK